MRVRKQTDEVFIPWYASFGTQQWLSVKAGRYGLNDPEYSGEAARKLARHLQEQFDERVLKPVAAELNPQMIRTRAAALYVDRRGAGVADLPDRLGLPARAVRKRLKQVTATRLRAASGQPDSLYALLSAEDPNAIAAYRRLLLRTRPDDEGAGLSAERFRPVTDSHADELVDQLALHAGAGLAGLAVGGVPGILLSIGVSSRQAMEHETRRPALEAELRSALRPALDEVGRHLARDPCAGVPAPVLHMRTQITNGLLRAALQTGQPPRPPADVF